VRLHESRSTVLPNSLRSLLIAEVMSRADLGNQSSRTRRMLHWQSVRTFSAFGTWSNSVGSITWPAQWHRVVHYHRDWRGKMATDHHQSTCHRAVAAGTRRRPRPLRIKQSAPNTEGAEALAIAHPSAVHNPSRTDVFGAGTGEKGREVGAVRCHDLRTQAPQFSASARQSTRKPEKTGTLSSLGAGNVPRTTILTS
jgi:hypothetical protein